MGNSAVSPPNLRSRSRLALQHEELTAGELRALGEDVLGVHLVGVFGSPFSPCFCVVVSFTKFFLNVRVLVVGQVVLLFSLFYQGW